MDSLERQGQRPGWEEYFLNIARVVAMRATCTRRHVGCVLVRDQRLIATGYNGSVSGDAHCEDDGCIMENGHCVRCVHAEMNALLQCAAMGIPSEGATIYTTDFPCGSCARSLAQAGIKKVVYQAEYPDDHSRRVFELSGIEVYRGKKTEQGFILVREV